MKSQKRRNIGNRRGRKPGYAVMPTQFDEMLEALGMTQEQVAHVVGGKLTRQAVASWKHEAKIPLQYLGTLVRALDKKIGDREPTEIERRVKEYLADGNKLATELIDAMGTIAPRNDAAFHISTLREGPSPIEAMKGQFAKPAIFPKESLSAFDVDDLVAAIEAKGYEVFLRKLRLK